MSYERASVKKTTYLTVIVIKSKMKSYLGLVTFLSTYCIIVHGKFIYIQHFKFWDKNTFREQYTPNIYIQNFSLCTYKDAS